MDEDHGSTVPFTQDDEGHGHAVPFTQDDGGRTHRYLDVAGVILPHSADDPFIRGYLGEWGRHGWGGRGWGWVGSEPDEGETDGPVLELNQA